MDVAQTAVPRLTTIDVLERLVSFDTTSRDSNPKLNEFARLDRDGFDPRHTTIDVGAMESRAIPNIVPEREALTIEWRIIPGGLAYRHLERTRTYIADTIEPTMKALHGDCGFALEMRDLGFAEDDALATIVKQVGGSNSEGKVAYGTEGGLLEPAGMPTTDCQSRHSALPHEPDERIAVMLPKACDRFVRRLADGIMV